MMITEKDKKRLTVPEVPPGWVVLEQAATKLGVSKQTVLNWVKADKIPYVRIADGRRRGLRIDTNSAPYENQPSLFTSQS